MNAKAALAIAAGPFSVGFREYRQIVEGIPWLSAQAVFAMPTTLFFFRRGINRVMEQGSQFDSD